MVTLMLLALSQSVVLAQSSSAFGIHVIDEATGRGVPMVTLETGNRIQSVTDSAGWVAFDEPGLMGKRVFFSVKSPGYVFTGNTAGVAGVVLETRGGEKAEIKVMRASIAERMYRVTGQGIYREATRLGMEVPLPRPNMNGEMITHGAAQVTAFQDKLFWVWRDARGVREPRALDLGCAATSDFPGRGGLDASLGIHFEFFSSDGIFKTDEPGNVRLDGLLTAKDADGKEHMLAHYKRTGRSGELLEHGIAEFNSEGHVFEPVTQLGEEFDWQCPRGHAVQVKDHFYFGSPFCVTRVPTAYDDILDPSKYEALAWSEEGGAIVWQGQAAPLKPADEDKLVAESVLPSEAARLRLRQAGGGPPLSPTAGSVTWNPYRKRWIMIASDGGDAPTQSGKVWYAEATDADGPWAGAICVLDEAPLSLSDALHPVFLDQEEGRIIHFECTVSADPKGASALPRYERNRMLYRLDLGDARLAERAGGK